MHTIQTPSNQIVYGLGPPLEAGPLPTFIYFSISGKESLTLGPYNEPVTFLPQMEMRCLSFTIPGHEEGLDKFAAIDYIADNFRAGNDLMTPFFDSVASSIEWLIQQKIIDPNHLAIGGLSRGVFVGAHIAARVKEVKALLGFAPMTKVSYSDSFKGMDVKGFDLDQLVGKLDHVQFIRFYMGNRDTLVGTANAFSLMEALVEHNDEHRVKQSVELFLIPSIGRAGHGTSTATFKEGAHFIEEVLR